jgi:hypothetical protein
MFFASAVSTSADSKLSCWQWHSRRPCAFKVRSIYSGRDSADAMDTDMWQSSTAWEPINHHSQHMTSYGPTGGSGRVCGRITLRFTAPNWPSCCSTFASSHSRRSVKSIMALSHSSRYTPAGPCSVLSSAAPRSATFGITASILKQREHV